MRYLVTGYTSGIGCAVTRALESRGHEVYGCGRRTGASVCLDFEEAGLELVEMAICDHAVEVGSPYDGVFHAGGLEVVKPLKHLKDSDYRRALAPLLAAAGILRAVARGAVREGGSIVMMSSVAAQRGVPAMGLYSASRAGIEALVRSAAVELASQRIRVNALAAGATATPMHSRIVNRMPPATVGGYCADHPLGFGEVGSVADAALFLLGDESRWVTGTTMVVDGGYLA